MTPAEFEARFSAMVGAVRASAGRMLETAGVELASTIRAAAPKSVRNAHASLGVVVEPGADQCRVRGTGPWGLVEGDIRAHDINPRNARALNIGGAWRAHAHHPGVRRANGPFARGVEAGAPAVGPTVDRELVAVMRAYL